MGSDSRSSKGIGWSLGFKNAGYVLGATLKSNSKDFSGSQVIQFMLFLVPKSYFSDLLT